MSESVPSFLSDLASRRRFGMRPGLDTIRALCAALGDPQNAVPAIHIAGTNGKGAVAAILDSCLRAAGRRIGRYTSPHLVRINERFFLDGIPVDDARLERCSARVADVASETLQPTFFEALTAVAFLLYAEEKVDFAVLETGLGGRLDATTICAPRVTVITRIGLDHCDWLGDTVEKIAREKAGIIKPGVPVVLGANEASVRRVIRQEADRLGAPFVYAPDVASDADVPFGFALPGAFNRENAVTALAALRTLAQTDLRLCPEGESWAAAVARGFRTVVWPGRFQRVGDILIDGAHNPPAARALVSALTAAGVAPHSLTLVAGFCGDKDVDETLRLLAPFVRKAFAVRTNNLRSLAPEELAARMTAVGIEGHCVGTFGGWLKEAPSTKHQAPGTEHQAPSTLICGSLFLAGEALVALGVYPWQPAESPLRFDPAERLNASHSRKFPVVSCTHPAAVQREVSI